MPAYSGSISGKRFRSLLELSFIIDRGADCHYEIVKIRYRVGVKGRWRTYVVDFVDPFTKTMYEVKPWRRVDRPSRVDEAKWAAARVFATAAGFEFRTVTERDLRQISLAEAIGIEGVTWSERTKRSRAYRRALRETIGGRAGREHSV